MFNLSENYEIDRRILKCDFFVFEFYKCVLKYN